MRGAVIGLAFAAAVTAAVPALAAGQDQGPVLVEPDARAEFLRTARIVKAVPIGKGVTRPMRLTLSDGTVTHDAAFQGVDERTRSSEFSDGVRRAGERNFVDYWGYNVAAYRLAVLLGLGDMMPVTVSRSWNGNRGALSWWVDDVMMDEEARQKKGIKPPDQAAYERQVRKMSVFAALVGDTDRNKGNVLYTSDWHLVMLDFTRAFRMTREIREPDRLQRVSRELFAAIQALTEASAMAVARDFITVFEVRAMLARRDLIVQRFERLIRERGAENVFY
ncbi:MAG: hypothetical protein AB7H88_14585 [Vicinamibacterales bacterium]